MTNSATHDALERAATVSARRLPDLTPAERTALESQFEDRFRNLVEGSSSATGYSFPDLVGFGARASSRSTTSAIRGCEADFDESVIPSQLHAAAELYYIYQHERMKVFQVVDVLRRLFQRRPHAHPARPGRARPLHPREVDSRCATRAATA